MRHSCEGRKRQTLGKGAPWPTSTQDNHDTISPMITVIHGDNELQIRATVEKLRQGKKSEDVTTLTKPDPLTLRQNIGSVSMFFDTRLYIIEGMLAKGVSEEVVDFLATLPAETMVAFVEYTKLDRVAGASKKALVGKKLLDTLQKRVARLSVVACNDYSLFDFLDTLSPGKSKQIVTQFDALLLNGYQSEEIYYMVVDHIRNLVILKDTGGVVGMHAFRVAKLRNQAAAFTLVRLEALYQKLYQLEVSQKERRFGEGSPFPMAEDLRFFLASSFT